MEPKGIHASGLQKNSFNGGAFYLKGNDSYWLSYAEKIFRENLDEDSLSLRILEKVSGVSEIVSAFDTICFSEENTVVIVKDDSFTPSDKDHNLLLSFLKQPLEPNYLVFVSSPFLNTAEIKQCTVIDCSAPEKSSLGKYVERLFPAGIEKNAMNRLMELCDYNMARIGTEAAKLNSYCDNTLVSADDVELLVIEDTETTVFLFSNCVIEGQFSKAEKHLDKLLKRGEKPAMLLSVLSNQFRRMLYCAITPLDNKSMADLLGIKEFAVDKTRKIKSFSQSKIKEYVSMLTDYEFKFKSGIISDEVAFSSAISRLLSKEAV